MSKNNSTIKEKLIFFLPDSLCECHYYYCTYHGHYYFTQSYLYLHTVVGPFLTYWFSFMLLFSQKLLSRSIVHQMIKT